MKSRYFLEKANAYLISVTTILNSHLYHFTDTTRCILSQLSMLSGTRAGSDDNDLSKGSQEVFLYSAQKALDTEI